MSLPRAISWRRSESGSPILPPPTPVIRPAATEPEKMFVDPPVIEVLSSAMLLTEKGKLPPPPPAVNKTRTDRVIPACLKLDRKPRRHMKSNCSQYSGRTQSTFSTAATESTSGTWGSVCFLEASVTSSVLSASSAAKRRKKLVRWKEMTSSSSTPTTSSTVCTNDSNSGLHSTSDKLDRISPSRNSRCKSRSPLRPASRSLSRKTSPPPPRKTSLSPPRTNTVDLQHQVERMEAKIRKAAQIELSYLNNAKEVRTKKDRLVQSCQALEEKLRQSCKTTTAASCMVEEDMQLHVEHLKTKIDKATRVEKCYLKKCKQVHDKRYRWTKLYEATNRDLQRAEHISSSSSSSSSSTNKQELLPPLFSSSSLRKAIVNELGAK